MDIDLARRPGGVLGLKVQPTRAVFDSIRPGLTRGRYDGVMPSFTDTKERETQVDFVTCFSAHSAYSAGASFTTRAQGGGRVSSSRRARRTPRSPQRSTNPPEHSRFRAPCAIFADTTGNRTGPRPTTGASAPQEPHQRTNAAG
jgi:hypothetical protein